jgi:CDP-paratose 2-epimerase
VKVLVTGSDGFVGRTLVDMLLREKDHEGNIFKVSAADIKHITPLIDGTQGPDLAKESTALRLIENGNFGAVVHLASSVSTPASVDRPLETFRNTVRTAVHVLEGCRLTDTPCILTSSVKARDGMTPYGASKRMAELWAEEYRNAYRTPIIINRPGTIYGPGQEGSTESGWIAWFLKAKAEGLKVTINGDGEQVRDLLHVTDYCRLLVRQLKHFGLYAEGIWDVGGGRDNAVTVREMVEYLDIDHEYGPPRYGDADKYIGVNDVPDWEPNVYWRDAEVFR